MSTANTPIVLSVLGPWQLRHGANPPAGALRRKEQALLAYLAVESDQPHRRDALMGLFWPLLPASSARSNLRVAMSRLKQRLPSDAVLAADRNTVRLIPNEHFQLDVQRFLCLIQSTEQHDHARRATCRTCQARLQEAVALYRGEFLTGFFLEDCLEFDEWLLMWRERLHVLVIQQLEHVAAAAEQNGQVVEAEHYARRQIELSPLHESAHRQLMRLLAKRGQRAAAVAQYELCRQSLREELGVEPEAETMHLYRQLTGGAAGHVAAPLLAEPPSIVHNLPAIAPPFFGREPELAHLSRRLQDGSYRLLSLVGPGGIGKTRLAQEAARENLPQFPDGAYFVSLAAVRKAEDVPLAIAQELGMTFIESDQSLLQQVLAKVRLKKMLLVLDNLEQLLAQHETASALIDLLLKLLNQAPGLTLLVTSRERLDVQIEDIYYVQGLPVPEQDDLATASRGASVRLFCERVHRRHKAFKLTAENLPSVLAICRLVEGMPLGLELAATWTHSLDWDSLVAELEQNLIRLETTLRDIAPQHRSLAIAFEHSWRLLTPAEQATLAQLAVFESSFALAAAQHVTGCSLMTLTRLSYKSLIREAGSGRYDMHKLLWHFAREKLQEQVALEHSTRRRHRDYFLRFVGQRSDALHGEAPQIALAEIREDLDNIRQAWQWCLEQGHFAPLSESGCLVGLSRFFQASGLSAEGERLFRQAITGLTAVGPADDLQLLHQLLLAELTEMLIRQDKLHAAIACANEVVALADTRQDAEGQARGRQLLGYAYGRLGHAAPARDHLEVGLALVRQIGQTALEGEMLRHLGNAMLGMGDRALGKHYLEQALRMHRTIGNRAQEQAVLLYLGVSYANEHDHLKAWNYYQEAQQLVQATGDRYIEARIENAIGFELAAMGQLDAALPHHQRSREISHEIDNPAQESHALHNLCTVNRKRGFLEPAEAYGREALRLGQLHQLPDPEAYAWLHLGYVLLELEQLAAAATAFEQARTGWLALEQMPLVIESLAGLAAVAAQRGELDTALTRLEPVLTYMTTHPLYGADEPFQVYVTCYQILHAHQDPRAPAILAEARQQLEERLTLLPDETTRRGFVANIPAHRTLMAL